MGINPVLARIGYESWTFHKGSSEYPDVRIPAFVSVLHLSAEQPTEEKPGAGTDLSVECRRYQTLSTRTGRESDLPFLPHSYLGYLL